MNPMRGLILFVLVGCAPAEPEAFEDTGSSDEPGEMTAKPQPVPAGGAPGEPTPAVEMSGGGAGEMTQREPEDAGVGGSEAESGPVPEPSGGTGAGQPGNPDPTPRCSYTDCVRDSQEASRLCFESISADSECERKLASRECQIEGVESNDACISECSPFSDEKNDEALCLSNCTLKRLKCEVSETNVEDGVCEYGACAGIHTDCIVTCNSSQ